MYYLAQINIFNCLAVAGTATGYLVGRVLPALERRYRGPRHFIIIFSPDTCVGVAR